MSKPFRLSVTVSGKVFDYIVKQSLVEGRSMSNLISYLLERTIDSLQPSPYK
jgi:hypothetical protein